MGAVARIALEYAFNAGLVSEWWIPSLVSPLLSLIASVMVTLVTPPPSEKEL